MGLDSGTIAYIDSQNVMFFLTWNLQRTEQAFRVALSHLGGLQEDFIAALQELPDMANSRQKASRQAIIFSNNRARCLGVVGSTQSPGRLGLFASVGVSSPHGVTSGGDDRLAMVVLQTTALPSLYVVGIHAFDRRNVPTEHARAVKATHLRMQIDNFWKPNQPLVVLGDFNAEPYHPEVSARSGMFAIRDRAEVRDDRKQDRVGEPIRPLYNPMWALLPESSKRPGGTYRLKTEDQGIRWRTCDQVLVSRELIDQIDGEPEILPKLGATELTTKLGYPLRGKISDHLPVQLHIRT